MGKRVKINVDFTETVYDVARLAAAIENKSLPAYVNCSVQNAVDNKGRAAVVEIIKSNPTGVDASSPMEEWEAGIVIGNVLARNYVQEREYARDPELLEIRHLFIQDARHLFEAARVLGGATYATFKCRIVRDWAPSRTLARKCPYPISAHIPISIW